MPIACQSHYTVRLDCPRALCTLLKGLSKPQLTSLSLLTFGLFVAGNCQLPRVAVKLPLPTGAASLTQRLRRLVMNKAIEPAELFRPVAGFLLSCFGGARLADGRGRLGQQAQLAASGCPA